MYDLHWARNGINFACDADKRLENVRKHEIDLIRASGVFFDPFAVSGFDADHSEYEDRYSITGKLENEKIVYAIYMFRGDIIRLISARKANKQEVFDYEKQYI